jgi:hypothetical protein
MRDHARRGEKRPHFALSLPLAPAVIAFLGFVSGVPFEPR